MKGPTEISGRVVEEMIGKGSKSERRAILLDTGKRKLVLRRQGANPFSDPVLNTYIGKTICGVGNVTGYTFIVSSLNEVEDAKKKA